MNGEQSTGAVWGWQGQLKTIAKRAQHILGKGILSDMVFRVGSLEGPTTDIKAHKLLLALADPLFERMFYGPLAVTSYMVRVTEIELETFRGFLRYIYHDETKYWGTEALLATIRAAKYSVCATDSQEDISNRLQSIGLNENENILGPLNNWQGRFKTVAKRAKFALKKGFLSDVTFRVGLPSESPVEIKAHRFLLAMGSAVFESMFYGPLADTNGVIEVDDIDQETFRILLRFLYHDDTQFSMDHAITALGAAKKYSILPLKHACEAYMRAEVTAEYCLAWFVQAKMFGEADLANFFMEKIDDWGPSVLLSEDFLELELEMVKEILVRDSLNVKEMDLCIAAMRWAVDRCRQKGIPKSGQNLRSELGDALFLIRFPLLTAHNICSIKKHDLLLYEEVDALYRYWFNKDEAGLPPQFITRKRQILTEVVTSKKPIEVTMSRFGLGEREVLTYMTGCSDVVGFSIQALTRCSAEAGKPGTPAAKVAVNLVAIGLFVKFQRGMEAKREVSLEIFKRDTDGTTELPEFRQSCEITSKSTRVHIHRFQLKHAVPITAEKYYIIMVKKTSMCKSVRSANTVSTITKSAGDFTLTAQFRNGVFYGQIPEFHFTVTQ